MRFVPNLVTITTILLAWFVDPIAALAAIQPGDKLPWVDLHWGFPPQRINLPMYCAGRKVIIVGLPGAFTPTCSSKQVPGYLEYQHALQAEGVDEILIYSVNDGAVMKAWFEDQKLEGSRMQMMGDPYGEFTKACGMELTHPGPVAKGLLGRCKRFAMLVVNCVVQHVAVAESETDPAGDDAPEATLAPAMLQVVQQYNKVQA